MYISIYVSAYRCPYMRGCTQLCSIVWTANIYCTPPICSERRGMDQNKMAHTPRWGEKCLGASPLG